MILIGSLFVNALYPGRCASVSGSYTASIFMAQLIPTRSDILAAVLITSEDLWHVTPCRLVYNYRRFEGRSVSVLSVKLSTRCAIS